ncbi:nucleotide-binding protein [Pseudomonas sp. P66]|uniref:Nucleotide-binding protein n=1 Tax=Pseudomonas arcuscaelestis TaxID=2710591 RepID=A0ABS2BTK1_9PSED|nr:nucleotide-binding protein [Pseudomonas arcuscaelestis]MBM5456398.1 nucleotide-binding protein [Pseudomonas arcuscaelestis]
MSSSDIFTQINNCVLDLQSSQHQTYAVPLKKLARLLSSPELESVNANLTQNADLEAFLSESEATGGSFAGSHRLAWPDDDELKLGLTILLIQKLSTDPNYALNFGYHFFSNGSKKMISGLHAFVAQVIIPFARDYKSHVKISNAALVRSIVRSNKVFIVHGHDDGAKHMLARFIDRLGLESIILQEQPDRGRTIIEKFEQSAEVGYAVVLLTPDDVGGAVKADAPSARARQNVIFELGYFAGKLGRGRVCLLRKGNVEIPSDLFGVVYTELDSHEGWQKRLVMEMKEAGLDFDASRLFS